MALERRDHLDDSIDRFIDNLFNWFSRNLGKFLAVLALLAIFWIFLLPKWQTWVPYLGTIALLIFQFAYVALLMIFQFVVIFWFLGKPRLYWVMPGETGVGFADYKGNPEVLEGARRIVTLLRGIKDFKAMGGEVIRGLLLYGPPGTGKSYLAQCISTEAGVPFGYLAAPSIQGMFWGMDVMRVWNLYRKARGLAKKYGACILFIDEIDAIGASRSSRGPAGGFGGMMMGGGSGALNQLLNEMDPPPMETSRKGKLLRKFGFKKGRAEIPVVLTIGATNLPDVLDAALLRPGRFDRKIAVDLPSAAGRREIIDYYLAKVRYDKDLSIDDLVHDTIGYTPVAIKYVINEAVIVAHFADRSEVSYEDFSRARENHELGLRQPVLSMSYEEKRRIAYHESGHAVASLKLMLSERVVKVSIVRHGQALGFVQWKPKEERFTQTKEELLARIQVSLASRAAEEIFLGIQMSGVTSDLENATSIATAMAGLFGMNGSLSSFAAYGAPDEKTRRVADRLLREQYSRVKILLLENRDLVVGIAEEVLEKGELSYRELQTIIQRVDFEREQNGKAAGNGNQLPAAAGLLGPAAAGQVAAYDADNLEPGLPPGTSAEPNKN